MANHQPIDMLYKLLLDRIKGIQVTADDNVSVLGPNLSVLNSSMQSPLYGTGGTGSTLVYVKKDPYPQEKEIGLDVPLVVVGPRRGPRSHVPFAGHLYAEVHETVEIRVITRDIDVPFKVSGDLVREKVLENIRTITAVNKSNPDGTGLYWYIDVKDPGGDTNEPQGTPLYQSAMSVEVAWIE